MRGYKIVYSGKDITNDISNILVSLEVIDRLEGKAGDICLELEDHNSKFLGSWYPETDDKIEVWIEDVYCGAYWVDEVENTGNRSGIHCRIRAMSVQMKAIIKSPRRKSYRNRTLLSLANELAAAMGLKVKGSISGVVKDNCSSNDLAFLSSQSVKLGYILKVDSGAMVFSKYEDLKKQKSIKIDKKGVVSWNIKDKAIGRYSKCTCKYYNAHKKISYSGTSTIGEKGHGEAEIWEEVESNSEAVERAKDWLINKNKQEVEIELELVGDKRLWAGVHIELLDFGKKDASYIIKEVRHLVDRPGKIQTTVELQK